MLHQVQLWIIEQVWRKDFQHLSVFSVILLVVQGIYWNSHMSWITGASVLIPIYFREEIHVVKDETLERGIEEQGFDSSNVH